MGERITGVAQLVQLGFEVGYATARAGRRLDLGLEQSSSRHRLPQAGRHRLNVGQLGAHLAHTTLDGRLPLFHARRTPAQLIQPADHGFELRGAILDRAELGGDLLRAARHCLERGVELFQLLDRPLGPSQ